jgi:hypothetical protein
MPTGDYSNLRREDRKATTFRAQFHIDEKPYDCAILDISPGGAKLKSGAKVTAKSDMILDLDRIGKFTAISVWCSNGTIGIKFTDDPARTADAVMALAMFGAG